MPGMACATGNASPGKGRWRREIRRFGARERELVNHQVRHQGQARAGRTAEPADLLKADLLIGY